ncbi:MAG: Fic family protein [Bacteroidales bacterium]|nr:Fic family protein [Bacteroidales bacterium]
MNTLKENEIKISPLLQRLRQEKSSRLKGGIYHRIQIDLTYNSNHIEGSRLSKEQTRFIFETNTLGATTESTRIDDILETVNHFRCIDYVIDHATENITENHIKQLHLVLKTNTSDSQKSWFAVGEYKKLANEVGGQETTQPEDVQQEVKSLLKSYYKTQTITFDNILDFHVRFERIHPFQDGNGRIGRLLILWQCLQSGIVPFIITEDFNDNLTDTCLSAQDNFKVVMDYFRIEY